MVSTDRLFSSSPDRFDDERPRGDDERGRGHCGQARAMRPFNPDKGAIYEINGKIYDSI